MVVGVSGRMVLPPDQYVASLARKRMAAGALFRDEAGGGLLVNPVYKPTWDLPGGAGETGELPHRGGRRGGGGGAWPCRGAGRGPGGERGAQAPARARG